MPEIFCFVIFASQGETALDQFPVTYLGKAPDALEREKRKLQLSSHPAFGGVCSFVPLTERRTTVSAFVGEVFGSV